MASNLRDREGQALGKMITLSSKEGLEDFGDQWKVLIFDRDGRDIISPLMNVTTLRQKGVTLHLLIDSDREAIPDAPAIYFVRPTEDNINRLVADCAKQMYRSFHIHFLTRIEKPLLEKFAQMLVATGNPTIPTLINRVVDEYLDVIALEPNLYTFNIADSYIAYNDPKMEESQIQKYMNRMSMSLLSLVRIMNAVPVIRSAPDGPAQMLATQFCKLLQENLHPRGPASALLQNSLISDRPRPLLLIFDRSNDLAPLLQHNSTYQALIDDLLDHRNNRVTVENSSAKDAASKKKVYDLNSQTDAFLAQYSRVPFPEAVDANQKSLAEVSRIESEIRSRPSQEDSKAFSTKDLSDAIESLPEILNRKANLETHTSILQAVMSNIAAREVPSYFEAEQTLMSPVTLSSTMSSKLSTCAKLLSSPKGLLEDKARLYLLAITYCQSNSSQSAGSSGKENEELDAAFQAGCEAIPAPHTPAKEAIEKVKAAGNYIRKSMALRQPFGGDGSAGGFGNSAVSATTNAVFSMFAKATSFFTRVSPMSITRVVDNLSEGKSCPENDSYVYLDPRQQIDGRRDNIIQKFSEVIVFVIGGGSYAEYDNLQELVTEKIKSAADSGAGMMGSGLRSIVYGTTEIINGDKFLKQLESLGSK